MNRHRKVYKFEEDGVPLGESDGQFVMTVNFFGEAEYIGYGEGCGRAGKKQFFLFAKERPFNDRYLISGESYAMNVILGTGRLQIEEGKTMVIGDEVMVRGKNL